MNYDKIRLAGIDRTLYILESMIGKFPKVTNVGFHGCSNDGKIFALSVRSDSIIQSVQGKPHLLFYVEIVEREGNIFLEMCGSRPFPVPGIPAAICTIFAVSGGFVLLDTNNNNPVFECKMTEDGLKVRAY
jgi:hypothetical protein